MSISYYRPRGCWLYFKLSTAILGIILGFSAFVCFLVVYRNYHCAAWSMASGVFAAVTLIMHIRVYRDVTYAIQPVTFQRLKVMGVLGAFLGLGVFVGYLVKGMLVHEKGVDPKGWFIVTVWGYMTCKWGFLLFWYARKYCRALVDEITEILAVN